MSLQLRTYAFIDSMQPQAAAHVAATSPGDVPVAGMSQLFANLGGATASATLPPLVQQAAMQLLAQRPLLDASLSGSDVKVAFRNSGLFLEKTLATGTPTSAGGESLPDLKAALIVFRQLLSAQLGGAPATGSAYW